MAYDLRLHEKAYEEYIAAYEWYEMSRQGLGDRFMHCVEEREQQISERLEATALCMAVCDVVGTPTLLYQPCIPNNGSQWV
jgi:recombinational DNA repair protein (RecF pathway)